MINPNSGSETMNTLNVPHDYETIQAAVDAAHSGDKILIAPGIYHESLHIIKKDYLQIIAHPGTVMIDGEDESNIGIEIKANHIYLNGLELVNFVAGIVSIGHDNIFSHIICAHHHQSGISFIGHRNQLLHCQLSDNQGSAISFAGNYNIFKANRVKNCLRGIVALGSSCDNYFIKNFLTKIETYALGIISNGSNHNIFYKNMVDDSKYGIIIQNGSSQLVKNNISHCHGSGILIGHNQTMIRQNTLKANETGLDLYTDNSEIIGNTIQNGNLTGIQLNGHDNNISQNVVIHYQGIGILINGFHNKQTHNTLKCNKINMIENNLKEGLISVPKNIDE